jgi:hypothetical protein
MKHQGIIITLFVLFSTYANSQSKKGETCGMSADQSIGVQYAAKPDKEAEYPEGKDSLKSFLRKHSLLIRSESVNSCEASKAEVEFVVKKDGSVGYVKLLKPASCDALKRYMDEMFGRMPVWKAAQCNGKPVNSKQKVTMNLNGK